MSTWVFGFLTEALELNESYLQIVFKLMWNLLQEKISTNSAT